MIKIYIYIYIYINKVYIHGAPPLLDELDRPLATFLI
jgi:hypothetical protein